METTPKCPPYQENNPYSMPCFCQMCDLDIDNVCLYIRENAADAYTINQIAYAAIKHNYVQTVDYLIDHFSIDRLTMTIHSIIYGSNIALQLINRLDLKLDLINMLISINNISKVPSSNLLRFLDDKLKKLGPNNYAEIINLWYIDAKKRAKNNIGYLAIFENILSVADKVQPRLRCKQAKVKFYGC